MHEWSRQIGCKNVCIPGYCNLAPVTRGTSSSRLGLSPPRQTTAYLNIEEPCQGDNNNKCSFLKPCCICSPDMPTKKKEERSSGKICGHRKQYETHVSDSIVASLWISGFFKISPADIPRIGRQRVKLIFKWSKTRNKQDVWLSTCFSSILSRSKITQCKRIRRNVSFIEFSSSDLS